MSIYTVNGSPVKCGNKWLTNGGTPSSELPPYDSTDAGKALVVNDDGDGVEWQDVGSSGVVDQTYDPASVNPQSGVAVAQAISGVSMDEVPAVTSSDNGKVLTASYSGGQGSYSWETAPSAPSYSEGNMIDISAQGVIGVETTAGITDIQMVNALPANPVATVLYLIPAT